MEVMGGYGRMMVFQMNDRWEKGSLKCVRLCLTYFHQNMEVYSGLGMIKFR